MGEIAAAGIRCAQRRTDEQRESACKDQRQQQTVDHTTHRMGKCGSKNPLNEDHRGADQGIFFICRNHSEQIGYSAF